MLFGIRLTIKGMVKTAHLLNKDFQNVERQTHYKVLKTCKL